nr:unnamed protein product [Naegleria fowleri]
MKKLNIFKKLRKKDKQETVDVPQQEEDDERSSMSYDEDLMFDINQDHEEVTEEDLAEKQLRYQQYSNYSALDLNESLEQILNETDPDYRVSDFSYIDVIARSLKNGTAQEDLRRLKENKQRLDDAVQQIVCVNYKGFNKSIRNFSDMLELMERGRTQVGQMMQKVKTAKELLSLRTQDLISLYSSYLQQKEILDILTAVENVKSAPEDINKSVSSKHFLHAVRILKTYSTVAHSDRLRSIKALHEVRAQFVEYYDKLPDLITDELRAQLHIQAYQRVLDYIDEDDWNIEATSLKREVSPVSSKLGGPRLNTPSKRLAALKSEAQEVSSYSSPASKTAPILQDNLSIDYEKQNPSQYMILLVEALDVMNKLPEIQSRLVQSLRFDLRHLIEAHISEFSNSLKSSDRHLLWLIIQNKRASTLENQGTQTSTNFEDPLEQHKTNTGRAILQGKLIAEMMEGLFVKLKKVLKNYQFLVQILEQKNAQKGSSYSGGDEKELGAMSIVMSKEVLTRIRDAINDYMYKNRNDSSEQAQLLKKCMEDLLYNFIDQQMDDNKKQRVKVLINIMETQLGLNTNNGRLKKDALLTFKSLIVDTLSSPDTPSVLSVEHVWKTVEDEVGSVLRELLGIRNSEMEKQNDKIIVNTDLKSKSKKKNDFDCEIMFKFSANMDFALFSNSDKSNDETKVKTLCESMSSYFIFSPYNIIWMYKVVLGFVLDILSCIKVEHTDHSEGTNEGSTLRTFMDNFIRNNFIPLIEEDYKAKLSKSLNSQDFLKSSAFLPREAVNQTTSTYTYSSQTEKRPLLNSVLFMSSWLRELFKVSLSLPMYKVEVFQVIDLVLKNYLAACKVQFNNVVNGKFIQQSLTTEYESVYPVLKADPTFKKLYSRQRQNSSGEAKQSEKFYQKLFVLVDEKLQINYPHSLPKTKFIDNNSQLILLANLNDSLEWLADLLQKYQKEMIQNEQLMFKQQLQQRQQQSTNGDGQNGKGTGSTTPVMPRPRRGGSSANTHNSPSFKSRSDALLSTIPHAVSDSNIRKVARAHHLRVLSSDAEAVNSDSDEETALEKIKKYSLFLVNYEKEYRELALKCLFALKLDIRVHCYHFIHCNLMDNLLKYGTYECEDERKEPEDFINAFNQDLFRIERYISCYLPKSKLRYLFESIERMILDLFIGSLPFAIAQFNEMKLDEESNAMLGGEIFKAPNFTTLGLEKMMRNIFGLQQQLSNFHLVNERRFEIIRDYFNLLQVPSEQILATIQNTPLRQLPFTQEQYEAILQTPYGNIKREVQDVILLRQLFDKKLKKEKKQQSTQK